MVTPTKADQLAESEARQAAGVPPAENTEALDPITDAEPSGNGPVEQTAAPEPQTPPPRPEPKVGGKFDERRADIIKNFRADRTKEVDESPDDITAFTRSGMPPELAPEVVTEPAPQVEEPAPAAAPAAPQKFKVKVHGQEQELTQEELIAHAQKSLAADNLLDKSKDTLAEVNRLLAETKARATSPAPGGQHQAPQNTGGTQDPSNANNAIQQTQPDEHPRLIDKIQFGDPDEAEALLQNTITAAAATQARNVIDTDRLKDEGSRSAAVLAKFRKENPDLDNDPMAAAAIEAMVIRIQTDDLKALGIDPANLKTAHGGPATPADIAIAHRWYRSQGANISKPQDMLEKATSDFLEWRGAPKKTKAADPADTTVPAAAGTKPAPRIEVSTQREQRRQAIPQQPSRTVAPRTATPTPNAPQPRDRSSIVADMRATRDKARGKVVVG